MDKLKYSWQIFFTKNIPIFKNLIEWNDEKKHKLEQLFFYFLYLLYHSFPILIYTYKTLLEMEGEMSIL